MWRKKSSSEVMRPNEDADLCLKHSFLCAMRPNEDGDGCAGQRRSHPAGDTVPDVMPLVATDDTRREKGLATLVKVESVCSECGIMSVFHMPKDWIQKWLNYGGGSPACKVCSRGLCKPGRALQAYHNGAPCELPDHWKDSE